MKLNLYWYSCTLPPFRVYINLLLHFFLFFFLFKLRELFFFLLILKYRIGGGKNN